MTSVNTDVMTQMFRSIPKTVLDLPLCSNDNKPCIVKHGLSSHFLTALVFVLYYRVNFEWRFCRKFTGDHKIKDTTLPRTYRTKKKFWSTG